MASYHHNTMKLNDMKTGFVTGNSSLKKCFFIPCGKTLNSEKHVMEILYEHVPELKVVDKVEDCDFILALCTVASRAGTDIERAQQKLHNNSDSKPAVVVVLHHTPDPECFVPDSSRSVQREKTITVDVLFHEDLGLLQCTRNNVSLAKVINYLKPQKEEHLPPPPESPSVFRRFWNSFTSSFKSTEVHLPCETKAVETAGPLQTELKLVLMGKSNSSKLMDTIKREINAQTNKSSQQSKMIIGEVIVVDLLDSGFRPGHVSQSSKASHDYYLLVIPVDEPTEGKQHMLNRMEEIFGRKCWRNTVIIFTDTKEGQSENQDLMRDVEECEISFLCLNVHENINRFQVLDVLKKVEMKVNENQDSEIFKVIESQIPTIKENIKHKERKTEKLKSDILNFETSIEREINDHESEVNRISDILQSDIEIMNNEVTAGSFKRSLQLRVNKTVREMKQKVKSLTVTLKREKSKIDKNWGVNEGGAGVDDPINLISNIENSINYLKSKMQKYMKENRTHVSMLEKKDRELEEFRQRNTELGQRNTEFRQRNTVLGQRNTVLEEGNTELIKELDLLNEMNTELENKNIGLGKCNTELRWTNTELKKKNTELEERDIVLGQWNTELGWSNVELKKKITELEERDTELQKKIIKLERTLKEVKMVEKSITKGIEKRPGEEGQGEALWQDCANKKIIKKHGQDQDAQRDDKNSQSDEEQSGEEHKERYKK